MNRRLVDLEVWMEENAPLWLWSPLFPEWWRWKLRPIDGDTNWPWIGVILCRFAGHGKLDSGLTGGYEDPPDPYTYCERCGDSW